MSEVTAAVNVQVTAGIALVSVCNPPVNAISQRVRAGLLAAVSQIETDDSITAAVIYCPGRTFMAGADVREFGKPALDPSLPEVTAAIATCGKPVIAVIHGQALGGGLEIALACSHRLAVPGAKLGLPEVKLGLIPGAGGTQRLPEVVGLIKAIEMVTSGKPVTAETALELGLIDSVLETDGSDSNALAAQAAAYVRCLSDAANTLQKERFTPEQLAAECTEELIAGWQAKLSRGSAGQPAPLAALRAIQTGVQQGITAGLQAERTAFLELRESSQAKALQHLFFAEKQAAKLSEKPTGPVTEIRTVAVVGAGTMGSGIALAFAGAGVNVLLLENSEEALQRGLSSIAASVDKAVGRGIFTPAKAEKILAAIQPMRDKSELESVDMLIEAVFEDMQVKQKLFAGYQQHCRDDVIWATNTSYLDINEIATAVERPENLLGVHFFSPANIMPLVEVVDADKTSTETLSAVMNLLKKMCKISVISGVCHGFIGNRMYQAYQREAGLLLMNGATPRQIDKALTDFGMAMGPFAVVDMSGIDIGYMMRQSLPEGAYEKRAFLVHDRLVETGRKGRKTGAGFYNYEDGSHLQDDPAVLELIEQIAAEQGAERREISDAEIVDRCILALMNEAGHILDEGIARSAADVDVVFVNGYGFPRAKGGPMFYAQSRGLSACAKKVAEFASTQGPRWWRSSQALAAAAEAGRW